jgi:hypothetical protein
MAGTLSILNVYEGDVEITFDKTDPVEVIRAGRIIKDCLRRGYALLIEVDGAYQRAIDFDEKAGRYIVADFDPSYRPQKPNEEEGESEEETEAEATEVPPKIRSQRGRPRRSIAMESTNAVAIARSAGG